MADEKLFPTTAVYVRELDTKVDAVATEDPAVYSASVVIPANTTTDPIVYTLEVYTNDTATGITASVTVAGQTTPPPEYYEASSMSVDSETLPAEGGTVGVTINFDTTTP